jgi:hypothetical protein
VCQWSATKEVKAKVNDKRVDYIFIPFSNKDLNHWQLYLLSIQDHTYYSLDSFYSQKAIESSTFFECFTQWLNVWVI